jgi:hypothetical protein
VDIGRIDHGVKLTLTKRDKRPVYIHEMAIYEAIVPLIFLRTGVPPFWFFALQASGHLIGALTTNKFYWWYGRLAPVGLSRLLMILAGCGWILAGWLWR